MAAFLVHRVDVVSLEGDSSPAEVSRTSADECRPSMARGQRHHEERSLTMAKGSCNDNGPHWVRTVSIKGGAVRPLNLDRGPKGLVDREARAHELRSTGHEIRT